MMSPFDTKNRIAKALDRFALRMLLLIGCVGYFLYLWQSGLPSLMAGGALFCLILLFLMLLEQRTLRIRERLLRERISGAMALEDLIMSPTEDAGKAVRDLLCAALGASPEAGSLMRYEGETWLIRCAQCLQGTSTSEGDVIAAHRARLQCGAQRCALASTSAFSPAAVRASEWTDPPVRLITGRQLAALFGRLHPATDEEIARHASRRKKPFSWQRIRALALAPVKLRRYLLCAFLLLLLYLARPRFVTLLSCLLSFSLALLCAGENRRSFRL